MSLIRCRECKAEISAQAVTCPHCGYSRHNVKTIEQTSKKYKLANVIGVATFIAGLAILSSSPGFGVALILLGPVIAFYAKVGAWWTNR